MKQGRARWTRGGLGLFLLAILVFGLASTRAGLADTPGTGQTPIDYDRPVWFLLAPEGFVQPLWPTDPGGGDESTSYSISTAFDGEVPPPVGSRVLMVQIGDARGGLTIDDARLEGFDPMAIIVPVAEEPGAPGLEHGDYPATVLGSFRTFEGEAHMITPDPGPIDPAVQEAFFNASASFDTIPGFPEVTTTQIVEHVYWNQDQFPPVDRNAIADALFSATATDDLIAGCSTCSAVGDLFPHEPQPKPIYALDFGFDSTTGVVTRFDLCRLIENFDVKPGSDVNPLNLGSKGVLPVAVWGSEDVDATEIDPASVHISFFYEDEEGDRQENQVHAWKYEIGDLDGDGRPDLLLHFRTELIFAAGADLETTELVFYAQTYDGECLKGSDTIRIVPPPGRGKN